MKQFINLLGVLVAGYFGYTLEPQLRPQLTLPATSSASPSPETMAPRPAVVVETATEPALDQPPAPPSEPENSLEDDFSAPEPTLADAPPEPAATATLPEKEVEEAPPSPPSAPALTPSADPVEAMKTSVRTGAIKEFTFDQVIKWEPTEDETVDGEIHQTGLASYTAETIFGKKTIQAKAFIKEGLVTKWVWLKSGMEIK